MILQLFNNHLELIIPEFYLTNILLFLLIYGVFYKHTIFNQKVLIIKNISSIILYLLVIVLFLVLNIPSIQLNILNGALIINNFTQFIKIILILCTFICFCIQQKYMLDQKINDYEITILLLISLLGLMLLVSSNHFLTLYLAIELQSLSFYILTASNRQSVLSVEAALKYFILGSLASGFILFGSSILYLLTGSLNYNNIGLIFSNIDMLKHTNYLISILFSLSFIISGLLFKIGAAPFHFWLPDVYEGAPNNVSSFFAITPKIAFFAVLVRLFFDIFFDVSFFLEIFFYAIAVFSMVIGSLAALNQNKIKRLLAYSSISHVGFILIGFTANLINNIPHILLYIIIYVIMSINLWTSYISVYRDFRPVKYLTDLSELYDNNKLLSIIIILNIFSLAGIPPLAGFFSKFFIFYGAIKANYFSLVFFAIIISIISSFYYLRLIKIIFFDINTQICYFDQISKPNSFILIINTLFIFFLFISPNLLLIPLNNIYLSFLIH